MARKQKTTFDYMMIGISPALVTVMVTSLTLFISTILNSSPFLGRLNFVLAMYSMATVAIARISIEEGKERAVLFGIPLAVATLLAISFLVQFQDAVGGMKLIYCSIVIAITWWSSHQLTWDCTVIEEHQESSKQGLLQRIGLEKLITDHEHSADEDLEHRAQEATEDGAQQSWFDRWKENRKKPHTPGVWVIYYSLAALPLFGLGQLFADAKVIADCFIFLFCYVSSGLGLLLTTSLLGLRRYLRQRDVEMPHEMAGMWLTVGLVMIIGFMAVAFLLPRPGNTQQLAEANRLFDQSQDAYDPSQYGMGPDGIRDGGESQSSGDQQNDSGSNQPDSDSQQGGQQTTQADQGNQDDSQNSGNSGRPSSEQSPGNENANRQDNPADQNDNQKSNDSSDQAKGQSDSEKATETGESGEQNNQDTDGKQTNQDTASEQNNSEESGSQSDNQSNDTTNQNQSSEADQKTNSQSSTSNNDQTTERSKRRDSQANQPPPESYNAPQLPTFGGIGKLFQILFWIAVVGMLLYYLAKNHKALWQALKEIISGFLQWFIGVFSGTEHKPAGGGTSPEEAPKPSYPPFSSFQNPFATNAQMTPQELVQYSFGALESLGNELGIERQNDQTPNEFSEAMAKHIVPLGSSTLRLGKHYSLAAYAPTLLNKNCVEDLKKFWQQLSIVEVRNTGDTSERISN